MDLTARDDSRQSARFWCMRGCQRVMVLVGVWQDAPGARPRSWMAPLFRPMDRSTQNIKSDESLDVSCLK